MRTHILPGNDVVECISAWPMRACCSPGVVTLQGCSIIMSLSSPPCSVDLSILVSAGNGQLFGGRVVGPLDLLVLTAMSFERAEYIRLPLKEEQDPTAASHSSAVGGGGGLLNLATGNAAAFLFITYNVVNELMITK
ncbi:AT-hook motif nuclear-localized protein 26-like [Salvia hispanica]|uniref:AT-hook motif nuclear-localized protein 26-like n=1 Tax=Salvia hispanica TaxID=49212 RepID=UPI0020097CE7|nr:AT-hook motif nuclear-localized protein 26-like [Salvia hispanica]XP_047978561.1 AT-hook motif nuclear-localized protein 26-like [Salvia hispanica]